MSTEIDGPLVRGATEKPLAHQWEAPDVNCPDCGQRLSVMGAAFYGGIVSGVTWILQCVYHDSDRFEYQTATSFVDEAYGAER